MESENTPDSVQTGDGKLLSPRQEKIALIASYTAKGDMPQLKREFHAGLDAGLTVNEIKEIIIQMYAYCGFPRCLNASFAFEEVVNERSAKGIKDDQGRAPNPFPTEKSRYEIGQEILGVMTGVLPSAQTNTGMFIPEVDIFLKEHLFADIIARDNLSIQDREIATVAALTIINVPQLQSHKSVLAHVGFTEAQVESVVALVKSPDIRSQTVTRAGIQPPSAGGDEHFTGNVTVNFLANTLFDVGTAYVTFSPGARSAWHRHPSGQTLIVTDGVGLTQEWGGPIVEIHPGDVVVCPPVSNIGMGLHLTPQ